MWSESYLPYFLLGLVLSLCDVTTSTSCELSSLDEQGARVQTCWTETGVSSVSSTFMESGGSCTVICLENENHRSASCLSGDWVIEPQCNITEDVNVELLTRKKRFFDIFVSVVVVVGFLFSGRSGPPPDRSPPHVTCPPDIFRYSDPIQTNTRIDWDESVVYAVDDRDGRIGASRWSRKGPNYVFGEGVTKVYYHARDRAGNSGHCIMSVTVETIRCSPGPNPAFRNGYYVCHPSSDFVYGTTCNYGCYYGYQIAGLKRRECLKSGQWSSAEPQCEVVTCPPLDPFPDGVFQCNDGHNFKSACSYTCKPGYDVKRGKSRVRVCGYDGNWRGEVPKCIDSEPPTFTDCPHVKTYYTEKNSSQALVNWHVPQVSDNSQTVTPTQTAGISNVAYHPAGVYDVVYDAVDNAGNKARPCKFKVVVKELKCFAQYPLPYMRVDCPQGYKYGALCDFSCQSGYTIDGSAMAVCEKSDTYPPFAYWEITEQPTCQALSTCPTLTPPDNGALACDLWEDGSFCQMQCMKGTDIPRSFQDWKLFVCNQQGRWNFDGEIPACVKTRITSTTVMTANIYYFDGTCTDDDVLTEIKNNFLDALRKSPFINFLDEDEMVVDNIKVTCGAVRERRSASSNIRVDINVEIISTMTEAQSMTAFKGAEKRSLELLQLMKEDVKGEHSKLLPDLSETARSSVEVDSQQVELQCPTGTLPSYRTVSCVGCTPGTYFSASNICESCPVGFYQPQPDQTQCLSCPKGKTTLQSETRQLEDCLPQCPLGHFSANGVEPCTPCDIGKYADNLGSTECQKCPPHMTTVQQGSTGLDLCKHFDISLPNQTSEGVITVSKDVLDLRSGFRIRLWVKCTAGGDILTLKTSGTSLLILQTNADLQLAVTLPSSSKNIESPIQSDTWYQVLLSYDSAILTVYLDNSRVLEETLSEPAWIPVSSLSLIIGGSGMEGSISQVNMWSSPITSLPPSQPSCITEDAGDILAWHNFTTANLTESFLQVPSICDDTDECLSTPCLHGSCSDILDGYECDCKSGFEGDNCEVNINDCEGNQCTNGGTCIDGVSSYTCVCAPDHTGEFCDANLVHGSWGQWSNWTECSTTCGPGQRTRVRRCDNPLPQNGGSACSGSDSEVGDCNVTVCPVCPELPVPLYGDKSCEDEDGMRRCHVTCDNGFDMDIESLPVYECGTETGYTWNYITEDNPGGKLPNCMPISPAEELEMEFSASYADLKCGAESKQKIEERVKQQANNIPCVSDDSCYIKHVDINNCDSSRQKRQVTLAHFVITVANQPSTLGTQASLNALELALQQLNSSAVGGNFTVTIQGTQYQLTSSPETVGLVTCPVGMARVNYYCVPCGPGTFSMNGYCERCDLGRYSNKTASTFCDTCPEGTTTPGKASVGIEECTVHVDLSSDVAFLSSVLSAVLIPVAVVAVGAAIFFYCKWKKGQDKVHALNQQKGPVVDAYDEYLKSELDKHLQKVRQEAGYQRPLGVLYVEPVTEELELGSCSERKDTRPNSCPTTRQHELRHISPTERPHSGVTVQRLGDYMTDTNQTQG